MDQRTYILYQLLDHLRYARRRKAEVFRPVDPVAAVHWLHGLAAAVNWADLIFPREAHARAMARRRLSEGKAVQQLRKRGLTPTRIVDELLAIEIEAWESLDTEKQEQEWAAFVAIFGEEYCRVLEPLTRDLIPDDGRVVWEKAFGADPTPEAVAALDAAGLKQLRAACEQDTELPKVPAKLVRQIIDRTLARWSAR